MVFGQSPVPITATESNYTGSFSAVSSCPTSVSVTPATSATGAFTVTPLLAALNCTITVTGYATAPTGTATASVLTPGGVQLRWYTPQSIASTTSVPVPFTATPINLIGFGSTYAATLSVSETQFAGTITASALPAGCSGLTTSGGGATGSVTSTLQTTVPNLSLNPIFTGSATNALQQYYTVASTGVTASGCSLTFTDNYPTPSSASITVVVTSGSGSGSFQ
jgi:hypothetical protein